MSIQGETYPIMLLKDAQFLVEAAVSGKKQRTDSRPIPSKVERASARAAIFTAFNLLEGLLIELTQNRTSAGPTLCKHCDSAILDEIRFARASISRTMTEWPVKILGVCVTGRSEFAKFKEIRKLRNQLIHPKLESQENGDRSQDDLLKECNADRCKEILYEVTKMSILLYKEFGHDAPPEFKSVLDLMKP
jgi:hypothetical protein